MPTVRLLMPPKDSGHPNMSVVVISNRHGRQVEIRGHARVGVHWNPFDPVDQFLDKLSAPTVSQLHAGQTVAPNPKNPRTRGDLGVLNEVLADSS